MKKYVLLATLALTVVALLAITASPALACQPNSPGYWKNHPDKWVFTTNWVGGAEYSQSQAIALMKAPNATDMRFAMFQVVLSAQLNVALGAGSTCPWDALSACQAFMAAHPLHPGGGGTPVGASSADWQAVSSSYNTLSNWWNL